MLQKAVYSMLLADGCCYVWALCLNRGPALSQGRFPVLVSDLSVGVVLLFVLSEPLEVRAPCFEPHYGNVDRLPPLYSFPSKSSEVHKG